MELLVLCGAGPGLFGLKWAVCRQQFLFVRSGFYSLAMGKSSGSFGGVQFKMGVSSRKPVPATGPCPVRKRL